MKGHTSKGCAPPKGRASRPCTLEGLPQKATPSKGVRLKSPAPLKGCASKAQAFEGPHLGCTSGGPLFKSCASKAHTLEGPVPSRTVPSKGTSVASNGATPSKACTSHPAPSEALCLEGLDGLCQIENPCRKGPHLKGLAPSKALWRRRPPTWTAAPLKTCALKGCRLEGSPSMGPHFKKPTRLKGPHLKRLRMACPRRPAASQGP